MNMLGNLLRRPLLPVAFVLAAFVVGCGGGGGDGAAPPPDDSTPPPTTGPARVSLGAAATFGAGAGTGITNTGTATVVNGDIGSAAVADSISGFHDLSMAYTPPPAATGCTYGETASNSGLVTGTINTNATAGPPTPECAHEGSAATAAYFSAASDGLNAARAELAAMAATANPGAELGGQTLSGGVFETPGGALQITGADLTLDAQGNLDAFWVFKATSLTVGDAAPRNVILLNGAHAKNVYWRLTGAAEINSAGGGTMVGNITANGAVTLGNGATLNGRAFSIQTISMENTVINVPAP